MCRVERREFDKWKRDLWWAGSAGRLLQTFAGGEVIAVGHKPVRHRIKMEQRRTGNKVPMGEIVMARKVSDLAADDTEFEKFVSKSLSRHAAGDWGDLGAEDLEENNRSLQQGDQLHSIYESPDHPKIWIITECDRSVTTIMFPSEYFGKAGK